MARPKYAKNLFSVKDKKWRIDNMFFPCCNWCNIILLMIEVHIYHWCNIALLVTEVHITENAINSTTAAAPSSCHQILDAFTSRFFVHQIRPCGQYDVHAVNMMSIQFNTVPCNYLYKDFVPLLLLSGFADCTKLKLLLYAPKIIKYFLY